MSIKNLFKSKKGSVNMKALAKAKKAVNIAYAEYLEQREFHEKHGYSNNYLAYCQEVNYLDSLCAKYQEAYTEYMNILGREDLTL